MKAAGATAAPSALQVMFRIKTWFAVRLLTDAEDFDFMECP
jgi:hypothetical protein